VERRGHLVAYSSEAGFAGDEYGMRLREDNGVRIEVLGSDALRELEPDLSPAFTRARVPSVAVLANQTGALVRGLASHVEARGGKLMRANVLGFETNGAQVTGVRTDAGTLPAAAVVVATGAWSAPLARALEDHVCLDTERGYHVEVHHASFGPRVPTLWAEKKLIVTQMDARVRAAGTVELAGLDAPPDWRRAALLLGHLKEMYPALPRGLGIDDAPRVTRWLGFRPSTPDSLPVIGPSARYPNAVYAFGHGHVGLTAAASTGRVVARLLSQQAAEIDLQPFSIARFK
jgi:glycine/D-amino acid oxidase-like deaminating enzyme